MFRRTVAFAALPSPAGVGQTTSAAGGNHLYLFSRQAHISSATGAEWAAEIAVKAGEASGNAVQLWAPTLSPGFGTANWTSWWPDLATLQAGFAKLQDDESYNALAAQGREHIDGGVDDALFQPIHGAPDPDSGANFVLSASAVCGGGSLARSMTAGIEIAQKADAITGLSTMFVRAMTGPNNSVGWLTGYEDLAAMEAANDKMAADADWLTFLDTTNGCFVEDSAVSQTTIWQKFL